ncbi:MAG: hypothetical protein ACK5M1_14050 [Xanthomarina gelatinilytica]|uniref:hypothetical protein n=1 Tax=Xanthomarina gelatinilytica TaxID=1137281 RepID=UPI003A898EAC
MKTISKYLMALMVITAIGFTGCRETKKEQTEEEYGHSHDEGSDHTHEHEEVNQEEFTVGKDTTKAEEKTHTHDNGETHHDH